MYKRHKYNIYGKGRQKNRALKYNIKGLNKRNKKRSKERKE